jgi:acyl-CoA synthetase (AMP-forming)/AMP-acid ligase II/acyl carrier protein
LADCLESIKDVKDRGLHIIYSDQDRRFISYRNFYLEAVRTGIALRRKGIALHGELILALEDVASFLLVFWGCILQGIRAIPYKITEENLDNMDNILGICENPKLITDNDRIADKFTGDKKELILLYSSLEDIDLTEEDTAYPGYEPGETDIAYIQFSSGSTSDVKGVETTHKMALRWQEAFREAYDMDSKDGMLSWMPLYHNMGLIGGNILPIYNRFSQYILPMDTYLQNPILWGRCIGDYKPTMAITTNFALNYFYKKYQSEAGRDFDWDFSSLKKIFIGAEPISDNLCTSFVQDMKPYGLEEYALSPAYGMAEATLAITLTPEGVKQKALVLDRNYLYIGAGIVETDTDNPNHSVFMEVGVPISATALRITDLNYRDLEEGRIGLICVKGDCVLKQYYRSGRNDAFLDDGWFNSGDLGFIKEGLLYITGRYKNMFLYNGKNCYSNDVEEFIGSENELLRDQVYIAGYRKNTGDINDTVICFIKSGDNLEECARLAQEIILKIHSVLGIYISQVVPVPEFPKTVSGKIKRYALVENYINGSYTEEVDKLNAAISSQLNLQTDEDEDVELFIEKAIREIKGEDIDIGESFIHMGLESIDISKLFIKIDQRFKNLISVSDLFDFQNAAQLSEHIMRKITQPQY